MPRGERDAQRERIEYRLSCALGRDIINKLSAIVGYTELLEEKTKQGESQRHLLMIRSIANSTPDQISAMSVILTRLRKLPLLQNLMMREVPALRADTPSQKKGEAFRR